MFKCDKCDYEFKLWECGLGQILGLSLLAPVFIIIPAKQSTLLLLRLELVELIPCRLSNVRSSSKVGYLLWYVCACVSRVVVCVCVCVCVCSGCRTNERNVTSSSSLAFLAGLISGPLSPPPGSCTNHTLH